MRHPLVQNGCAIIICCLSSTLGAKHICPHFCKPVLDHEQVTDQSKLQLAIQKAPTPPPIPLPRNFGRTHFIVGTSPEQIQKEFNQSPAAQSLSTSNIPTNGESLVAAYFSPDDGIQKILLKLIAQEQKGIKIAVFLFTNGDIAQALIDAKKHGIHIELVTDQSCLQDKFNKIKILHDAGLPIYVYKPQQLTLFSNSMHHKFIIFDQNKDNQRLLWHGSPNLTKSADRNNQESAVLSGSPPLIEKFLGQFNRLKERCISYSKLLPANA